MPVSRGEIYFISLDPLLGREQAGYRPVVIVSRDSINSSPLVVDVVPGTRGSKVKADYMSNVRVAAGEGNLPEETVFLTFQVRAVDHVRFKDVPQGRLTPATMAKIDAALAWTFDLRGGQPRTP